MTFNPNSVSDHEQQAWAAATLARRALGRSRPRVALLASQAAARQALLCLGTSAHRPYGDPDHDVLLEVASSGHGAAVQPGERLRLAGAVLAVMQRLLPRPQTAGLRDEDGGPAALRPHPTTAAPDMASEPPDRKHDQPSRRERPGQAAARPSGVVDAGNCTVDRARLTGLPSHARGAVLTREGRRRDAPT